MHDCWFHSVLVTHADSSHTSDEDGGVWRAPEGLEVTHLSRHRSCQTVGLCPVFLAECHLHRSHLFISVCISHLYVFLFFLFFLSFFFVFIAFIVLSVNLGQPALMAFGLSGSLSTCFMYICIIVSSLVANKDACLLACVGTSASNCHAFGPYITFLVAQSVLLCPVFPKIQPLACMNCTCGVKLLKKYVFTGRMPQSGKLPLLNLLRGPKSGFFRPAGATRCTDSRQTWQGRRAPGSAWLCKMLPQSAQRCGNAAPKYQTFPLFGKESPHRGDSLDRFRIFLGGFYTTNYPTLVKLHVICFPGYGVIAEKPRVRQLGQMFSCTL